MREIELIKDLDYNYKYRVLDEVNKLFDGDHTVNTTIELVKKVYTANEIVDVTPELESIATDVTNSFISTFEARGGATDEQIYFAKKQ